MTVYFKNLDESTKNKSDDELIHLLNGGDEKTYEVIFKRYYAALCAYAFDLLKNEDVSEEIVQEIFLKLWENRATLEVRVSLKSYLYRIIHNQCLNFLKHDVVVKKLSQKYSQELQLNAELTLMTDQDFLLDSYFYPGVENDIEMAVNSLPEQCKVVFHLSRYEMLGHEQIASRLNISVNTVKTQISRALEKLRSILKPKLLAQQNKFETFR
jgi:RNA polymerase sigma-70 factor (ECF subfamily)